jgi:hypothetical protein
MGQDAGWGNPLFANIYVGSHADTPTTTCLKRGELRGVRIHDEALLRSPT